MSVLVDTSVWSLMLRRRKIITNSVTAELKALILEGRVNIIGPIRQETLSGVHSMSQFENLRGYLRVLMDIPIVLEDYESAADFFNIRRRKGVQVSKIDFLICAVAVRFT